MFSIQCSNDFTDDKWRVKPGPTLSADQPGYFQCVRIYIFNQKSWQSGFSGYKSFATIGCGRAWNEVITLIFEFTSLNFHRFTLRPFSMRCPQSLGLKMAPRKSTFSTNLLNLMLPNSNSLSRVSKPHCAMKLKAVFWLRPINTPACISQWSAVLNSF